MHSLRTRLLAWVLVPLACTVALDAWLTYREAQATALAVQDRLLLGSARSIAEQLHFEDGAFVHQIPPAALELFQSSQPDHIYYRVTTAAGRLLAGYTELHRPDPSVPTDTPYFFNAQMRGSPVRVVALFQPVVGDPSARPVIVQVAQTLLGQQQMVISLWQNAVLAQLLLLVLAGALILFGLQRGLRPLLQLRERVSARVPGTLTPMSLNGMPTELQPLVASLNDYIRRLEAHADAQGTFIQNAAHQLRTPFALLNTQLSFALRSPSAAGCGESVVAAHHTLQQAIRLVNQLLTLSVAQSLASAADEDAPLTVNLTSVIQEVFESLAAQAQGKDISLSFEPTAEVPDLRASHWVLKEMLLNLVDNAIRYTPRGGAVTVTLALTDGQACVTVQDNGIGIAAPYRDKVFERFFRIHNSDSAGSGLGLAIVQELADRIGAQVQLADAAGGSGLAVHLRFAAANTQHHFPTPTDSHHTAANVCSTPTLQRFSKDT